MKTINLNKHCYVQPSDIYAFHIYGGGGNRRRVILLGEETIEDIAYQCGLERPESGEEWLTEGGHHTGLTNDMIESGIGRIDMDGDYESYFTVNAEDIDIEDKDVREALSNDRSNCYDVEQLLLFMCQNETEEWQDQILAECGYEREEEDAE